MRSAIVSANNATPNEENVTPQSSMKVLIVQTPRIHSIRSKMNMIYIFPLHRR